MASDIAAIYVAADMPKSNCANIICLFMVLRLLLPDVGMVLSFA